MLSKLEPQKEKSGKDAFYQSHRLKFEFSHCFLDLQLLKLTHVRVAAKNKAAASRKNNQKIQIIACEISKMHLFQTFFFVVPTMMTHHF